MKNKAIKANDTIQASKPKASFLEKIELDKSADTHWYKWVWILAAVGLIVRLTNIQVLSFWVDEYVHVIRSRDFINGVGPLFTDDNNGILYTFILVPLHLVFGVNEFTSRLPSAILGAGSIVLIFLIAQKLYNGRVGFIAAFLHTFSLYMVYWSRLARNYAIFEFFYLFLIFALLQFESSRSSVEPTTQKKSLKWGILSAVAFLAALLSHQLVVFVFFILLIYLAFIGIKHGLNTRKWTSTKALAGIFGLLITLLLLTPTFATISKPIFQILLPEKIANWILLDWTRIGQLWQEKPFEAWDIYFGMFSFDYGYLWVMGLLGLLFSIKYAPKAALRLGLLVGVPLLLMSFFFREPALPRYYIFVYPFQLILIAFGLYFVGNIFAKMLSIQKKNVRIFTLILPCLLVLAFIPYKDMWQLLSGQKTSGFIVNKKISHWSFTNWKDPALWVKSHIKSTDLVFSTVPYATDYYLGIKNSTLFRQKQYNTSTNKYEQLAPVNDSLHANSSDDFYKTLSKNLHVWVLGDYYLYNAMTDIEVRDLLFKNFIFHADASSDGSVQVFEFDPLGKGLPQEQMTVIELGKSDDLVVTQPMMMDMPQEATQIDFKARIRAKGVDGPREAIVYLNEKVAGYVPVNTSGDFQYMQISIPHQVVIRGNNILRIGYNKPQVTEKYKGFLITDFQILN